MHDAGSRHSDRSALSANLCCGFFNQRTRGSYRSLQDLLGALGSMRVEPRLLEDITGRVGHRYGDLGAAEIKSNHKVTGRGSGGVIFEHGVFLSRKMAS